MKINKKSFGAGIIISLLTFLGAIGKSTAEVCFCWAYPVDQPQGNNYLAPVFWLPDGYSSCYQLNGKKPTLIHGGYHDFGPRLLSYCVPAHPSADPQDVIIPPEDNPFAGFSFSGSGSSGSGR